MRDPLVHKEVRKCSPLCFLIDPTSLSVCSSKLYIIFIFFFSLALLKFLFQFIDWIYFVGS